MNSQQMKKNGSVLAGLLWTLLLPVCPLWAQDNKDAPVNPPTKDAKAPDKKDVTSGKDVPAQDKKDVPRRPARKERPKAATAHDHDHDGRQDAEESGIGHFLAENQSAIQITSAVIFVAGIAIFVYIRLQKNRKNKDVQPAVPTPGQPQSDN